MINLDIVVEDMSESKEVIYIQANPSISEHVKIRYVKYLEVRRIGHIEGRYLTI